MVSVWHRKSEVERAATGWSAASLVALSLVVTACSGGGGSSKAATAKTAADVGGMEELVKAAEAEGALNVIAVPPEWANYKGVLEKFKAKYPKIKVDEQGLDFNSQQEIDAVNNQKGTDKAPDVLDLAPAIALANTALLAPYQSAAWADIPANLKESTGLWVSDYAGFMSIGCDTKKVAAPATVADLLKSEYKGMVALNGNPKSASSGLHGVVMAALANGGSADDISAGVKFFNDLNTAGNLLPVDPTPATIASGQTPCVIDWEYNNAAPDGGPRDQGHRLEGQRPDRRPARRVLLLPGHQQGCPASGGGPLVGRVPLHARSPERVAEGLRPTRPAGEDDRGRDHRPGRPWTVSPRCRARPSS